jgi:hypothetical protein
VSADRRSPFLHRPDAEPGRLGIRVETQSVVGNGQTDFIASLDQLDGCAVGFAVTGDVRQRRLNDAKQRLLGRALQPGVDADISVQRYPILARPILAVCVYRGGQSFLVESHRAQFFD